MRRHTDLSQNQLVRIAESKRVPCPFRPCSAPAGQACANTTAGPSRGAPLGGLGAHVARLDAARQTRTPAPRPGSERPGRALATA